MRHLGFLLGAIIVVAASTSAQVPQESENWARTTLVSDVPTPSALYATAESTTPSPALPAAPEPAQEPGVQSVFQEYDWQAYFGYTFFRFYAHSQLTNDMNGLNLAVTYYPHGGWLGIDSEFVGTFGSALNCCTSKFVMGAGGARARWLTRRSIELWAHGLVGYSHFLPQTAYGGQAAFAYETGGGVDLNIRQQRWAIRLAGDMIGTHYFGNNQFSPKFSAGFVIKF